MAKETVADTTGVPTVTDQWETVAAGLGEEWNFEADGDLIGNYLGTTSIDVPDTNHPGEMRTSLVHQFAPRDDPSEIVFAWGSYSIDQAFGKDENGNLLIPLGTLCRVIYKGKREIKGGKQSLRHYIVQRAKEA